MCFDFFKMFGRGTNCAPIDSDVTHSGAFLSKCDPQKFKSFQCHPRKVVFVSRLPTDLLFQVPTSPTEDVFVFLITVTHRKAFCFWATRRKSELFQCTNRRGFPRKTTHRRAEKACGCNIWSTATIKEHKISRKWAHSTNISYKDNCNICVRSSATHVYTRNFQTNHTMLGGAILPSPIARLTRSELPSLTGVPEA